MSRLIFNAKVNSKLIFLLTIFYLGNFVKCDKFKKYIPEDMLELEELAIIRMKAVWNITNDIYNMGSTNITAGQMEIFSQKLIKLFLEIHEAFKIYERKIIFMQPDKLMNRIIDLQELEHLQILSNTPSNDPIINWRVKWVEVSSMATHIHWLYNKRVRDILTRIPYIKTIATSIAKYYGNPWHSVLSGNIKGERRVPQRYYSRLIDERLFSVKEGDLFFGLHKLLSESKSGKTGSAVKPNTCAKEDMTGMIYPVRLDTPIYVLFYLCLVDFKFYVLENYFAIYQEAFEGMLFPNYSTSDDRLRKRIQRKIDSYNLSFKNYKADNSQKKVMTGYYHCDPPPVDADSDIRNHDRPETYLRLSNFLTVYVELEKTLSPSGSCSGTCIGIGKASDYCKTGDTKCLSNLHPDCEKDPSLCNNYTPPCPIEYLHCFASGMHAYTCHAEERDQSYAWLTLDGKIYGPKENGAECEQFTTNFNGTVEIFNKKKENCEVCLCQCFEPVVIQGSNESIRLFSMNEVVSRVAENRVIAGIKFEQVGRQIHFVIADGVSLPGFMVDNSTLTWLTPTAADPAKPETIKRLSKTLKTFYLDDLKAVEGAVLTGIRFIEKPKNVAPKNELQQMFIGITIQTTKVDHITGELDASTSEWIENVKIGNTTQYNYVDPDNPIRADGPAVPDSAPDQFIEFRATSFKKDAGQTVIPFFDSQKMIVESSKNVYAIRGLGIFHRQKPGFGGFLGLKILPYGEYSPF